MKPTDKLKFGDILDKIKKAPIFEKAKVIEENTKSKIIKVTEKYIKITFTESDVVVQVNIYTHQQPNTDCYHDYIKKFNTWFITESREKIEKKEIQEHLNHLRLWLRHIRHI